MVIEILGYILLTFGGIGLGAMFLSIFFRRDNDKMNNNPSDNRWRKF
ncbi:MAG: hypothetical protein HOH07_02130 [Euryarchaeota archaeon]|nr:hypothetical protein [Euryarchaeota archaeon]